MNKRQFRLKIRLINRNKNLSKQGYYALELKKKSNYKEYRLIATVNFHTKG
jgi:hypothetical protein